MKKIFLFLVFCSVSLFGKVFPQVFIENGCSLDFNIILQISDLIWSDLASNAEFEMSKSVVSNFLKKNYMILLVRSHDSIIYIHARHRKLLPQEFHNLAEHVFFSDITEQKIKNLIPDLAWNLRQADIIDQLLDTQRAWYQRDDTVSS